MSIKLVSCDLNGTLVHQHTMSDLILVYKGKNYFERANNVFEKQLKGDASFKEAFKVAGPLS